MERTIESFAHVPNGGLVLPPDITTNAHRDLIIALAAWISVGRMVSAPERRRILRPSLRYVGPGPRRPNAVEGWEVLAHNG